MPASDSLVAMKLAAMMLLRSVCTAGTPASVLSRVMTCTHTCLASLREQTSNIATDRWCGGLAWDDLR